MPAWVIDTNVVVAGLASRDNQAPTRRILSVMVAGDLRFVASEALLAEYRRVLLRPKVRAHTSMDEADIDLLMRALLRHVVLVDEAEADAPPPEPGDVHLWRLLAALELSAVLVTGDALLLDHPPPGRRVVTPAFAVADMTL